jgi:hypothetical protein
MDTKFFEWASKWPSEKSRNIGEVSLHFGHSKLKYQYPPVGSIGASEKPIQQGAYRVSAKCRNLDEIFKRFDVLLFLLGRHDSDYLLIPQRRLSRSERFLSLDTSSTLRVIIYVRQRPYLAISRPSFS